MSDWECKIYDDPMSFEVKLYMFRINGAGKLEYAHIKDNGNIWLTQQENRHDQIEPFLKLNQRMAKELFKGLAQALDSSGFKSDSVSKAEGKLEATKYHLEDLRKMLKLSHPLTKSTTEER